MFGVFKIIVVDIFDEKLEFFKFLGVNYIFNLKEVNVIKEIKKIINGGVDVVIEIVGS